MLRRVLPIALSGVLAACGGSAGESASSGATATTLVATAEPPAATASTGAPSTADPASVAPTNVPDALQFTAPLLGGGDIEMAKLAGRPVLLWFWAPW